MNEYNAFLFHKSEETMTLHLFSENLAMIHIDWIDPIRVEKWANKLKKLWDKHPYILPAQFNITSYDLPLINYTRNTQ